MLYCLPFVCKTKFFLFLISATMLSDHGISPRSVISFGSTYNIRGKLVRISCRVLEKNPTPLKLLFCISPVNTTLSLRMRNCCQGVPSCVVLLLLLSLLSPFGDLLPLGGVPAPDTGRIWLDTFKVGCCGSFHVGAGEVTRFFQSMAEKKGCAFISGILRRLPGSTTSILVIRSLASRGISAGKSNLALRICWKMRYSLAPRKGGLPVII
mmetsp:Transcript_9707/g.15349  ORF Transcript_9707/g.15349 Transcript_9707/m.15349 type:complete len:210 (-) Transcript_9707:168-797(-)